MTRSEREVAAVRLRAFVVGAAAGGGFPQWNCNCGNCRAYWAGAPDLTARSQSSLAVTANGRDWALLNASPDIRQQIMATPALRPRAERGLRDTPITSVLLTNGDIDHVAGLLTLREKQPLDLFATGEINEVLRANPLFAALDPDLVIRRPAPLDAPIALAPGLEATLFSVPGKVPLFMEGDGPVATDLVGETTVGVELRANGATAYYIPGCAKVTPELAARLRGAELVFFDGTLWRDDEMIREGVGQKTGRRMGHISMSGPDGSIAAFDGLGVKRKIFVHINNTNPTLRETAPERAEAEAAGWEIAYDGMEASL